MTPRRLIGDREIAWELYKPPSHLENTKITPKTGECYYCLFEKLLKQHFCDKNFNKS
jgi:hypothetical protein